MFYILVGIGGFLAVLGSLIFLVDAFKVHWGWGLGSLVPGIGQLVALVCLFKHWGETKRGFLLCLVAVPFLAGAAFTMPKPGAKNAQGKEEKINDPFFNAIQKARETVTKVQESRKEEAPQSIPGTSAVHPTDVPVAVPAPTPLLTLAQRLANNRATFKALEADFAALNVKRKALPKKDPAAIAAFNLEAKTYADKLAEARSEQAILIELQRTAVKK